MGERVVGGGWGQMVEVMYCGGSKKELMAAGDGETSQRKVMRFVYSTSFRWWPHAAPLSPPPAGKSAKQLRQAEEFTASLMQTFHT